MENRNKLYDTVEMFKPFLDGENLSPDIAKYFETVYYVPNEKIIFDKGQSNSNLFEESKLFPNFINTSPGYFVAEFWFPYLLGGLKKSNFFVLSHVFQLDFQQIELELKKIPNASKDRFEVLLKPENIAYVLQTNYNNKHPFLIDENSNKDYEKLAEILYNHWGHIIGKIYDI